MSNPFLTFRKFTDPELARIITEQFDQAGIEYNLTKDSGPVDSLIIGDAYLPDYVLKIQAGDFSKANTILDAYYKPMVDSADPGYYLFGFSNNELMEIISRPDEWGHFDYQLAKKILQQKNINVDDATLLKLKERRNDELSKPESSALLLLALGYTCILAGILSIFRLFDGDNRPFPLVLLIGCFIGHHLYRSTKTIPDGTSVPAYKKTDRLQGSIILVTSIVLLVFSLGVWIKQLANWYGS